MAAYAYGTRAAFIQHSTANDELVYVYGEIDTESERDFRDALTVASQQGRRVIVDLTACTYIGSQGFGVLFDARSKIKVGVVAPPRIRQLMALLRLSDIVVEPIVKERSGL